MSRPQGRTDPQAARGARVEQASTPATPTPFPDGTRKDINVQSAKGLSITTRCATVDEFVTTFGRYVENSGMFIPNARRSLGTITQFAFNLAGGKPVLAGMGAVVESFETNDNRFRRPGILVELQQLGKGSAKVFERLVGSVEAPRGKLADVTDGTPVPVYAQSVTMPIAIETPISPRTLSIPPPSKPGMRAHTMVGLPIVSRAPAPAETKAPAPAKPSTKTAFKVPAVIGPPLKKAAASPTTAKSFVQPVIAKPAAVPEPVEQELSNDFLVPNDTLRDVLPFAAQAQHLGLAIDDDVPYETTSEGDDDISFDMPASNDSVALARGSVVAISDDAPASDLGLSDGSLVAVSLDALPLDAKALEAVPSDAISTISPPDGPLARGSLDARSYEAAAIARASAMELDPAARDEWSDAGWDNEWSNDVPTVVPSADERSAASLDARPSDEPAADAPELAATSHRPDALDAMAYAATVIPAASSAAVPATATADPLRIDALPDDDLAIAESSDVAPSHVATDDGMLRDVHSRDALAVEHLAEQRAADAKAAVIVTWPRRLMRWTARAVTAATLFATTAAATMIISDRLDASTAATTSHATTHGGANLAAAIKTTAKLDELDVTRTGIAPDLGTPVDTVAPAKITTAPLTSTTPVAQRVAIAPAKATTPKAKKPTKRPARKKPANNACSGLDCL